MEVLEHHMFRVTRNEDLEVEEDDAENLLQALEKELMRRRFGPPVRLEVEESIDPYVLDLLVRELKISEAEVYPLPGPLDLTGLFGIARAGPARAEVPQVHRGHPPRPRRGRVRLRARHLRRAARARRAAAPPVRLVLHLRPGLPGAGGGRPGRARDQADAVPDLGRLADSRRADRRRRVRQAGPRPGRDQGPLRRAGQHQVGAQAGGGRLPCRLRPRRPEDPLQAVAGGPPGGRHAAPLLPRRHRQLPPEDRPAVRGPRPAHRRPAGRRGPLRPLQPALRLLPPRDLPPAARRPASPCATA